MHKILDGQDDKHGSDLQAYTRAQRRRHKVKHTREEEICKVERGEVVVQAMIRVSYRRYGGSPSRRSWST